MELMREVSLRSKLTSPGFDNKCQKWDLDSRLCKDLFLILCCTFHYVPTIIYFYWRNFWRLKISDKVPILSQCFKGCSNIGAVVLRDVTFALIFFATPFVTKFSNNSVFFGPIPLPWQNLDFSKTPILVWGGLEEGKQHLVMCWAPH